MIKPGDIYASADGAHRVVVYRTHRDDRQAIYYETLPAGAYGAPSGALLGGDVDARFLKSWPHYAGTMRFEGAYKLYRSERDREAKRIAEASRRSHGQPAGPAAARELLAVFSPNAVRAMMQLPAEAGAMWAPIATSRRVRLVERVRLQLRRRHGSRRQRGRGA